MKLFISTQLSCSDRVVFFVFNLITWYSLNHVCYAKQISSSHQKITCSHHDLAETMPIWHQALTRVRIISVLRVICVNCPRDVSRRLNFSFFLPKRYDRHRELNISYGIYMFNWSPIPYESFADIIWVIRRCRSTDNTTYNNGHRELKIKQHKHNKYRRWHQVHPPD